jgi:acyl carrier protein
VKRISVSLVFLCLVLAAGCQSRWPKNQDPAVEERVIAELAKRTPTKAKNITRSTRLDDILVEEDSTEFLLDDLAKAFGVTIPKAEYDHVSRVGDVIDLLGYLSSQKAKK